MDTEHQYAQSNYVSLHSSQEGKQKKHAVLGERGYPKCANCDIEILWSAIIKQGKTYCCTGCAAGGPCSCDYSQYRSINESGVIRYVPDIH